VYTVTSTTHIEFTDYIILNRQLSDDSKRFMYGRETPSRIQSERDEQLVTPPSNLKHGISAEFWNGLGRNG
jgi:hypothetical protein